MMTQLLVVAAFTAIVLEQAHIVSPMVLAWSKSGFRRHMLSQPFKWLLWPALCLGAAVGVGLTSARHSLAFTALLLVYLGWQLIHFSMQNYGLMRLWGRGKRWLPVVAGAATAVIMLLSLVPLVVMQLYSVDPVLARAIAAEIPRWLLGPWTIPLLATLTWGHWISDIALSTSRMRRWWGLIFLVGILVIGASGFLFKNVSTDPRLCQGLAACTVMYSAPFWLSLNLGSSFGHYLYSRWVWQAPVRWLLAA